MPSDLVTIDSTPIVNPNKIDVGKFNLTKAARAADGTMNMEIIATKRNLALEWAMISSSDLKTILDLLDVGIFHTVVFPDPQEAGGTISISAYVGDINEGVWHTKGGVRYWQKVRIGLIER